MSKQKRFSKLAIVAGLILTASATCFAQTESTSQAESTDTTIVAINKAPRFNARVADANPTTITSSDATTNDERTAFSAARFMASVKDSVVNPGVKSTRQIRMEPPTDSAEFSTPAKSKRISFVPSRGPRFPQ